VLLQNSDGAYLCGELVLERNGRSVLSFDQEIELTFLFSKGSIERMVLRGTSEVIMKIIKDV
jgi:hypothetical protein